MAIPIGLAVEAGKQVVGGLTSIAGSIIGSGKRRREQRQAQACLLYTSPSPRDLAVSRMPSSA